MRAFTTGDLNKQVGEVTDAAGKEPVVITRHRKPRFVLMSVEPRRAYGPGETQEDLAELFTGEFDRLARGEGYDDEP